MASQNPESPAEDEPMSLEESFHNCFSYFIEAVEVLSLDAAEQCEVMDNFNVAREIQQDVHDDGTALINWPVAYLSPSERDAIAQLITPLMALPPAALLRHEHKQAMSHPAWAELRLAANRLRVQLDDAIKRNREFFDSQKPTD
jgi:hypothetical protein